MHYIHVKLLNGFPQPLTYKVPQHLQENLIGTVVKVPLKDRFVAAYVFAQTEKLATIPAFTIKEMHSRESFPADAHYQQFLDQLGSYYQVDPLHFVKRIRNFVSQEAEPEIVATHQLLIRSVRLLGKKFFAPRCFTVLPVQVKQKYTKSSLSQLLGRKKLHFYSCRK